MTLATLRKYQAAYVAQLARATAAGERRDNAIRELLAEGMSGRAIARELGISNQRVSVIARQDAHAPQR